MPKVQKFKKSIQEERCGRKLTNNKYDLLAFLQCSGRRYKTAIKSLYLNTTQPIPTEEEINHLIEIMEPVPEKYLLSCSGIYGIFKNNEIVYIGKTTRPFITRFLEHYECLEREEKKNKFIYKMLRKWKEEGYQIQAKPLICLENLKTRKSVNLGSIELGLIELYKPILNIEGKFLLYKGNGYRKLDSSQSN